MAQDKDRLARRGLLVGLAGLGGASLAGCREQPTTYGNILRIGDNFTYAAQRLLVPATALVREWDRSDISSMPGVGTTDPGDARQPMFSAQHGEAWSRMRRNGFADWRLSVEGSVARPGLYSLADLKRLPRRTQITKHTCEEGWSSIAEWTGTPLHAVLSAAGLLPTARWVNAYAHDEMTTGLDLRDALHPQTILAYGMNGRDLPVGHGAPVRLRVETQVGYKSIKYIRRLVVLDRFDDMGKSGDIQNGWSWYAGI